MGESVGVNLLLFQVLSSTPGASMLCIVCLLVKLLLESSADFEVFCWMLFAGSFSEYTFCIPAGTHAFLTAEEISRVICGRSLPDFQRYPTGVQNWLMYMPLKTRKPGAESF